MRCHRRTDGLAGAVDEVEHARRRPGVVHDLGEQQRAERRQLARLEHHGAAGGDRRGDLGGDLVERPVPRRDRGDHADRLAADVDPVDLAFEFVAAQHVDRHAHVLDAEVALPGAREGDRRAHLGDDRLREALAALLEQVADTLEQGEPIRHRRLRERLERTPRGGDGEVDVGRGARGDLPDDLLGRGIVHRNARRIRAIDPGSVDVEANVVGHRHSSGFGARSHGAGIPRCRDSPAARCRIAPAGRKARTRTVPMVAPVMVDGERGQKDRAGKRFQRPCEGSAKVT